MARSTARSPRQPRVSKTGPRGNALRQPLKLKGKPARLPPAAARKKPIPKPASSTSGSMGRCLKVLTQLEQFIENEFSPAQRAAIERHLAGCPDCRREFDAMRSLVDALDASKIVTVPDSFRAAVMKKVHGTKNSG